MKVVLGVLALLGLAGCETATTSEGCPVMVTEIGQAQMRACQQAYHERMAQERGGAVTRCIGGPGNMSCTTF